MHALGTCAGTEPMPNRHHMSFALELQNGLYWFDAGENCSYTAHLMGVDLLRLRAVFISHTHMDHVGGLGNLFWNVRKLRYYGRRETLSKDISVYIPNLDTFDGVMQILKNTENGFSADFTLTPHEVTDTLHYESPYDDFCVTAFHNRHMPHEEGTPWRSFSYCIHAEGKRIVFSGDTKLPDIAELLNEKTDYLLMETGHHDSGDIVRFLETEKKEVENLFFIHNGRNILADRDKALKEAEECFKGRVVICEDGETYEL